MDCGPLDNPEDGRVVVRETTFGSTASYSCRKGFDLIGPTSRVCQANGLWSAFAPTCRGVMVAYIIAIYMYLKSLFGMQAQSKYMYLGSLVPRPCAFVSCSTKSCANFVLQETNTQGLRTRLVSRYNGLLGNICVDFLGT